MTQVSSGLGLDQFLDVPPARSGGGDWDKDEVDGRWTDKGSITVWLHASAPIHMVNRHTFLEESEWDDRETGQKKRGLKYHKFASPESHDFHRQHYDRVSKDGPLKVPPTRSPFMVLREWIRASVLRCNLDPKQPIFQWTDHKNGGAPIVHLAEELGGVVKLAKTNFGHTLDPRLYWLFLAVDAGEVAKGCRRFWATAALGNEIRRVIKDRIESVGSVEGDIRSRPYAIMCRKAKGGNPMLAYSALPIFDAAKAPWSDELAAHLTKPLAELPDVLSHVEEQPGDDALLRACMEKAMQVDLPLDALFSEDARERLSLLNGAGAGARAARPSLVTQSAGRPVAAPPAAPRAAVTSGAGAALRPAQATPSTVQPSAAAPVATPGRRVAKPPPAPPPVEEIPCDNCQAPMRPRATKCGKCGTEYEIDDESAAKSQVVAAPAVAQVGDPTKCALCRSEVVVRPADGKAVCSNSSCNYVQGEADDVPF